MYWSRASLAVIALTLAGCYFVSYEDVSTRSPYSQQIGKQYKSVRKAYIQRVSMDHNYKPTPSVYMVYGMKMADSGPEVLSSAELPIGTTFTVLKVMRCTDCYLDFEERVRAVVTITSSDKFNDVEVNVSDKLLGSTFVEVTYAAIPTLKAGLRFQ
jgi:hypothetical protein